MGDNARVLKVLSAAMTGRQLPPVLPEGFVLERPARGDAVLHSGFPITRFYILLRGSCAATVYSEGGRSAIAEVSEPVQVFGVSELLRDVRVFHASIYASSDDCELLSCPARDFMGCLDTSIEFAGLVLRYLAELMVRSMNKERERSFGSSKRAVAEFCCAESASKKLPYRIPATRKEMSERLHINLRTLNRKVDALKAEGCLSADRGKLLVTRENFERLKRLCGGEV